MYSLVKGYIQSRNRSKSEGDNQQHQRLTRTTSEPSDYVRFLSWESVSFVTTEVKKQIDEGLHWISISPEDDMAARTKRHKPEGTLEYTVAQSDTLAKIALKFDSTPSELTRLNKLASRMIFPGQTLFVPEKKALSCCKANISEDPQVITKAPEPSLARQDSFGHKHNDDNHSSRAWPEHEQDTVKLTKNVTLDEDEEHISDHFLQIKARYITDGQGIVSGVLLVTPHSIMFQPNVSDPLVMDRGQDTYCITAQMSAITSAAMYNDIAAMAIHDPLKHGRFYLDPETVESLSRQNSSGSESTPTYSPKRVLSPMPLNIIREQDDDTATSEDLNIVVTELLDDIITEVLRDKEKKNIEHHLLMGDEIRTSSPMNDPALVFNDISPSSEDSGITRALSRNELNSQSSGRADHLRQNPSMDGIHRNVLHVTSSADTSEYVQDSNGRSSQLECDISRDSGIIEDGMTADSSYFSSFSNEVKYWLGLQSQTKERIRSGSEEELMPRPAAPSEDLPLYMCLRISKKNWCLYREKLKGPGAELINRDQKRREYWFAIPHARVEHVYQFFNKWCPSIHNATDDDDEGESDEDAETSKESVEMVEEGFSFDEQFYACTPPTPKVDIRDELSKGSKAHEGICSSSLMRGHKVSVAFLDDFAPEMNDPSEILRDVHLKKLNKCLPTRTVGQNWELVYSTFCHGYSLKTLYHKMNDSYMYQNSPVLLVLLDDHHSIFGAVCSGPLRMSESFYGTGESFLYKFEDKDELKIFRWTGANHFYTKGDNDSIAFGGGSGNFGLWLDGDIYHGSSHPCGTYNNERLSAHEDFLCSGLEVWAFV